MSDRGSLTFTLDGRAVEVPDEDVSLLEVLRDRLGVTSAKDGCSPQGQCGCCTVWVDGAPRVGCVTPARRVSGRTVTTLEGVDPAVRRRWVEAFAATGASQCGFCTPGILMRLAGLEARHKRPPTRDEAAAALVAHLCRCTGWLTILDAVDEVASGSAGSSAGRDLEAAAVRARLEGGVDQQVGTDVVEGRGGFADDTAPEGSLVAVPDGAGGGAMGPTLSEARRRAGKVQGRNTTLPLRWPVDVPVGEWAFTLQTTWVEPAYLETDASWCRPGSEPASPVAN
ncbi:MAG TPA: 2Fe-2S iron-sulfur cluster-binding protein, partial [Acidimicrobiales bacterium]|nr:2Fe-2S iron-sulfur cluster-binding protein [Acidimicrobiales bacterium]